MPGQGRSWAVSSSHSRRPPPASPAASQRPSGLIATQWTDPPLPCLYLRWLGGRSWSQTRTVPSEPPEATRMPSGWNATQIT